MSGKSVKHSRSVPFGYERRPKPDPIRKATMRRPSVVKSVQPSYREPEDIDNAVAWDAVFATKAPWNYSVYMVGGLK